MFKRVLKHLKGTFTLLGDTLLTLLLKTPYYRDMSVF